MEIESLPGVPTGNHSNSSGTIKLRDFVLTPNQAPGQRLQSRVIFLNLLFFILPKLLDKTKIPWWKLYLYISSSAGNRISWGKYVIVKFSVQYHQVHVRMIINWTTSVYLYCIEQPANVNYHYLNLVRIS